MEAGEGQGGAMQVGVSCRIYGRVSAGFVSGAAIPAKEISGASILASGFSDFLNCRKKHQEKMLRNIGKQK